MDNRINKLYEFGEFRLDTYERVLLRRNETIILAPKVFNTLEILVKSNGKIITKQELMDKVWADSFVEESNLTQNIYMLRQTIGKEFIETIPRRGYRFASDVQTVSVEEKAESFNERNGSGDLLIAKRTRTQIVEEEFIDDSNGKPQTVSLESKKIYLGIAAGLAAILIASFFGYWIWNKNSSGTNDVVIDQARLSKLTDSGNVRSFAISPDGELFAYSVSNKDRDNSIYLKDLKLNQEVKVETLKKTNPVFLTFSPNGDYIYFLNKNGQKIPSDIYKITRFGGDAELVVKDAKSEFSFSEDGRQILFVRENSQTNEHSLIIRDLDTKDEKILVKKSFPDGFSIRTSPVWAASENKVYVISQKQDTFYTQLVSIDIETAEEELVPTPKWLKLIVAIAKVPNKNELILAARRNGKMSQIFKFNIENQKFKSITNDLFNYRKVSVSADGKKIVSLQVNARSNLKLLPNGEFGEVKELTANSFGRAGRHGLDILQDGRILYVSIASRNREVWLLNAEDNTKSQLTKNTHQTSQNPTSAPNGKHIYYVSVIEGSRNIKRMDLNGQNQIDIVTEKDSNAMFPAVSSGEKTLYFIRQAKGTSEIWQKNLPDGSAEKLDIPTKIIPNGFLRISPDGRKLAFQQMETIFDSTQNESGKITVGILSLDEISDEPKYFQIKSNRSTIRWTPTSDAFDFVENNPTAAIIKRQTIIAESKPKAISELPRTDIQDFLWMPNTNDLLISDRRSEIDSVLITNFD